MSLQFKVIDGKPSHVLRLLKRLGHKVNKRSHVKSSLLEMFEVKNVCIRVEKKHASIDFFKARLHTVVTVQSLENLINDKDNNEQSNFG